MKGIVTYVQASKLKEIGFDVPSLGYYTHNERLSRYGSTNNNSDFQTCTHKDIYHTYCLAPFTHDALKWFRHRGRGVEVYSKNSENKEWLFLIKQGTITTNEVIYNSQEEAESACLDKLLEIYNFGTAYSASIAQEPKAGL